MSCKENKKSSLFSKTAHDTLISLSKSAVLVSTFQLYAQHRTHPTRRRSIRRNVLFDVSSYHFCPNIHAKIKISSSTENTS